MQHGRLTVNPRATIHEIRRIPRIDFIPLQLLKRYRIVSSSKLVTFKTDNVDRTSRMIYFDHAIIIQILFIRGLFRNGDQGSVVLALILLPFSPKFWFRFSG